MMALSPGDASIHSVQFQLRFSKYSVAHIFLGVTYVKIGVSDQFLKRVNIFGTA